MIRLIAAIGENGELGLGTGLPWAHIKEDMSHFRNYTIGKTILMGKSTYKTFKKPLPGRMNLVLSHSDFYHDGFLVVNSIESALELSNDDLVIIGGKSLYEQYISIADEISLTRIHSSFKADTHWIPDLSNHKLKSNKTLTTDNGLIITIEEYALSIRPS